MCSCFGFVRPHIRSLTEIARRVVVFGNDVRDDLQQRSELSSLGLLIKLHSFTDLTTIDGQCTVSRESEVTS